MAVDHERIRQLLGDKEERADTSLRSKSLKRATVKEPPTTLTPYEWQQWYQEHGIPSSHRRPARRVALPWYKRLFRCPR